MFGNKSISRDDTVIVQEERWSDCLARRRGEKPPTDDRRGGAGGGKIVHTPRLPQGRSVPCSARGERQSVCRWYSRRRRRRRRLQARATRSSIEVIGRQVVA